MRRSEMAIEGPQDRLTPDACVPRYLSHDAQIATPQTLCQNQSAAAQEIIAGMASEQHLGSPVRHIAKDLGVASIPAEIGCIRAHWKGGLRLQSPEAFDGD